MIFRRKLIIKIFCFSWLLGRQDEWKLMVTCKNIFKIAHHTVRPWLIKYISLKFCSFNGVIKLLYILIIYQMKCICMRRKINTENLLNSWENDVSKWLFITWLKSYFVDIYTFIYLYIYFIGERGNTFLWRDGKVVKYLNCQHDIMDTFGIFMLKHGYTYRI